MLIPDDNPALAIAKYGLTALSGRRCGDILCGWLSGGCTAGGGLTHVNLLEEVVLSGSMFGTDCIWSAARFRLLGFPA